MDVEKYNNSTELNKVDQHEDFKNLDKDSFEVAEEINEAIKNSCADFLKSNDETKNNFSENSKVESITLNAKNKAVILIQDTIDNVLDSSFGQKVKKSLYLGLIATSSLMLKPGESEAQNITKLEGQNKPKIENSTLPAQAYSLSGEVDLSGLQRERQINQDSANKQNFLENDKKISIMAEHIKSPEYLQKLMLEFGVSEDEAKQHQVVRLNNLLRGTYSFVDEKGEDPNFTEDRKTKTFITEIISDEYNAYHEILGHKSVAGNRGLPQRTRNLFIMAQKDEKEIARVFNWNNLSSEEREKMDRYIASPAEIYARKKVLDIEMENLGIKKYGEKFTPQTYDNLMEAYKAGKLSSNAEEFIKMIRPEFFEEIFNTISYNSEDKNNNANSDIALG